MKCPTDSATLVMSERSGIEIDYCPECRGVWLDRGELDKIIDRATADVPPASQPAASAYDDRSRREQQPYRDQPYRDQPYRRKKKEHWLSELFD